QFILSSRYFPSMHMTLSSVCSLSLHDALPISGAGSGGAPLVSRVLGRCQQPGEPDRNSECEDAMGRLDDRVALITGAARGQGARSEEHTSELQSRFDLVCRLLLEKKNVFL